MKETAHSWILNQGFLSLERNENGCELSQRETVEVSLLRSSNFLLEDGDTPFEILHYLKAISEDIRSRAPGP